jgi:hypothetical protein
MVNTAKIALFISVVSSGSAIAQSPQANGQLVVQVRPEAAVTWQTPGTVLVKARLLPGIQLNLWAANSDNSCSINSTPYVISTSGTEIIPLVRINIARDTGVCLASSDGKMSIFLPPIRS